MTNTESLTESNTESLTGSNTESLTESKTESLTISLKDKKDKDIHIALLIMVKNEKKRLHITLESVIGHVDSIVAFDTGSTDNTIQILKDFSEKNNIPLHLKEGDFVDFSTSRNVSLDYADSFPEIDYLLLMDTNDELRGGKNLRKYAIEQKTNTKSTAYLMCQEWYSGQYDKYFNTRFIKAHEGWRYRGVVHEYMKNTKLKEGEEPIVPRVPDNIVLFQDRTQDDNKSKQRFERDKVLLLEEHKRDPSDSRTVFYLAQTYGCVGDLEDSLYYYKLRTTMEKGFWEERFHAYFRCGVTSMKLKHDWHDSFVWFMKSYEFKARVEPLIQIANYYKETKKWGLAYTFLNLAVNLQYPTECILFVDKKAYDYKRWHLMGIVAYYASCYDEGRKACQRAIQSGVNVELDTKNLQFYLDKQKEITEKKISTLTKKEFIQMKIDELKKAKPNLNDKQRTKNANLLWKLREKKK